MSVGGQDWVDRIRRGTRLGESHFREFKSGIDRSAPAARPLDRKVLAKKIGEELVSFANADGGELYIGVEDDGTITGLNHSQPDLDYLLGAARTSVHEQTPIPLLAACKVQIENKAILVFQTGKIYNRVALTSDGRCLQRLDLECRPIPAEDIQQSLQERRSREYDHQYVDGARLDHLDLQALTEFSRDVFSGQSIEKCLQYLDLATYDADGLRLRRAALLLFASDIQRWHPRCQVRVMRVEGTNIGVGSHYNVRAQDDHIINKNIMRLFGSTWDVIRPYLSRPAFTGAMFRETLIYPEIAIQEALINAIAHRDYAAEGHGIEFLIFDDRVEVSSPGGLLSTVSIDDLRSERRAHESRNAHIARVLREAGYMREIGEGMIRIFSTMRERDLKPPTIESGAARFGITFNQSSIFSPQDQEWLKGFEILQLNRQEQRVALAGKGGSLLSASEIMTLAGIVDTDEYRKLVERLVIRGILDKKPKGRAKGEGRLVKRFRIRPPIEVEQHLSDLVGAIAAELARSADRQVHFPSVALRLPDLNPYRLHAGAALRILGFVDARRRPLPLLEGLLKARAPVPQVPEVSRIAAPPTLQQQKEIAVPAGAQPRTDATPKRGVVDAVFHLKGYGFVRDEAGEAFFLHKANLVDSREWRRIEIGMPIEFEREEPREAGGKPLAARVRCITASVTADTERV